MSERPYVSFAEIKQRVPIPDVLNVLGVRDQFRGKANVLTGVCPIPTHRHGPTPNDEQFKIRKKDGIWLWHCFGDCQRGGDVLELVKSVTGHDDAHVRFWFAEHFGDRLTLRKNGARRAKMTEESPKKEEAAAIPGKELSQTAPLRVTMASIPLVPLPLKPLRFHLNLDPDLPYLRQRGLRPETIQRFGLGLCRKGLLQGYAAIPLFGYPRAENPIGYLGRWPDDEVNDPSSERPRYRFPEEFPRNLFVYGLSEALDTAIDLPLIVVEGPFKVFHLFQSGYPNTVATLGAHLSEEQAALLLGTGRRIVLFFDGDEAGYKGMRMAAGKLMPHTFVRVIKLSAGVEPDHLSAAELQELMP